MIDVYTPSWRKFALALAAIFMLTSMFAMAGAAEAKALKAKKGPGIPVSGDLLDESGDAVGEFEGKIRSPEAFEEDGEIMLRGVLSGKATMDGEKKPTKVKKEEFEAPLALSTPGSDGISAAQQQDSSCGVLFLDLGPLFLDVLGLQVDLSQIVLDVSAVPGANNLLGNLLCAITSLLDLPGSIIAIVNLLNAIFELVQNFNDFVDIFG